MEDEDSHPRPHRAHGALRRRAQGRAQGHLCRPRRRVRPRPRARLCRSRLRRHLQLLGLPHASPGAAGHSGDQSRPPQAHRSADLAQKSGGFMVTNSNCSIMGLAVASPLCRKLFGIEAVFAVTMQAISGAGFPGVASLDILGNVVPYIRNEEEKMQEELGKLLGKLKGAKSSPPTSPSAPTATASRSKTDTPNPSPSSSKSAPPPKRSSPPGANSAARPPISSFPSPRTRSSSTTSAPTVPSRASISTAAMA